MHIEEFRDYCLSFSGVTEEFPFDVSTLVFKVMGKIFVLADVDNFDSINVKCDPEKALELREHYPGVKPGFHMNKKHWNTVSVNAGIPDAFLREWIKDSYDLVVKGLSRKLKDEMNRF